MERCSISAKLCCFNYQRGRHDSGLRVGNTGQQTNKCSRENEEWQEDSLHLQDIDGWAVSSFVYVPKVVRSWKRVSHFGWDTSLNISKCGEGSGSLVGEHLPWQDILIASCIILSTFRASWLPVAITTTADLWLKQRASKDILVMRTSWRGHIVENLLI